MIISGENSVPVIVRFRNFPLIGSIGEMKICGSISAVRKDTSHYHQQNEIFIHEFTTHVRKIEDDLEKLAVRGCEWMSPS